MLVKAFFCYTEEMALLQERILADFQAFTQLEGRMPEAAMDIYLRGSLIEEIKSTNDIEGVRSTRKEIMAAMELPAWQRHKKRLGGLVEQYEGIIRGERLQLVSCEEIPAEMMVVDDRGKNYLYRLQINSLPAR